MAMRAAVVAAHNAGAVAPPAHHADLTKGRKAQEWSCGRVPSHGVGDEVGDGEGGCECEDKGGGEGEGGDDGDGEGDSQVRVVATVMVKVRIMVLALVMVTSLVAVPVPPARVCTLYTLPPVGVAE